MTHEDLRKRAVKWLTGTMHCSVVLSEMQTMATSEIPDAIGFQHHRSILVECKVSRADFRANQDKCHVRACNGVGQLRYFMVPTGLVQAEEVPEGYGLLWVSERYVRIEKRADSNPEANLIAERGMLVSALRRVREREFLVIVREAEVETESVIEEGAA